VRVAELMSLRPTPAPELFLFLFLLSLIYPGGGDAPLAGDQGRRQGQDGYRVPEIGMPGMRTVQAPHILYHILYCLSRCWLTTVGFPLAVFMTSNGRDRRPIARGLLYISHNHRDLNKPTSPAFLTNARRTIQPAGDDVFLRLATRYFPHYKT
jgi:hypothetical protein